MQMAPAITSTTVTPVSARRRLVPVGTTRRPVRARCLPVVMTPEAVVAED
jgi:hypothetical protein